MMADWNSKLRHSRLRRSLRHLDQLIARIPNEVPVARDITWLEVRRIAPALLARCHASDVASIFLSIGFTGRSNFTFVAGLTAALDSTWAPSQRLRAMALALDSTRCRWLIQSACRRQLLFACENVEWNSTPSEISIRALRTALHLKRSMPLWRRLLSELARIEKWDLIRAETHAHPVYTCLAQAELRSHKGLDDRERLWAAEMIALARYNTGDQGRGLARSWLLPLVERSTDRYVARTTAARYLNKQLKSLCHVTPVELAAAIERGIAPNGVDDYSNLREAFSEDGWERLHGAFRNWGILTELERFACACDRDRFWRYIEQSESKRRIVE
jgi:hypothetical protein